MRYWIIFSICIIFIFLIRIFGRGFNSIWDWIGWIFIFITGFYIVKEMERLQKKSKEAKGE